MSSRRCITRRSFAGGIVAAASLPLLSCHRLSSFTPTSASVATPYPPLLDHLVWLAMDLEDACTKFEAMTGIAPAYGGTHAGGTHNALVHLGPACYLEIAAPQAGVTGGHPWVDAALRRPEPHLYAYSMRSFDSLEAIAARAQEASIQTLGPSLGSRRTPNGKELRWRLLIPIVPASTGTVPFFIDWMDSPHPALGAPKGVRLTNFRLSHTEPSRIAQVLNALTTGLTVTSNSGPALIAELSSSKGKVILTS